MPSFPRTLILGLAVLSPAPAAAQDARAVEMLPTEPTPAAPPARDSEPTGAEALVQPGDLIDFAAATLTYDQRADIVTAEGSVVVAREGHRLGADTVVWNRKTGEVTAKGNVRIVDPNGNQAYGDEARVTEDLKDAAISNILVALEGGGRLAARSARRVDEVSTLDRAVYSPCAVEDSCGGKVTPVWQIKAVKIIHDPKRGRISYRSAWLEIGGIPIFYFPRFSNPDRGDRNAPGFLAPDLRVDRVLGVALNLPYYFPLTSEQDLTITPYIFTATNPMLGLDYRKLFGKGPIRAGGLVTYANRFDLDPSGNIIRQQGEALRGYVYASGQFQHSPEWRTTFSFRGTSDDTFLRRYDISQDDVLRNLVRLERFTGRSYFSFEGWAFQGLRLSDLGAQTPIVLPLIEYRFTADWKPLGGTIDILANTLNVTRTGGEDVSRALAQVRWRRTMTSPMGQRVTLTGQFRTDAYNVRDSADALFPIYAGEDGWHGRAIPAAALDIEWPFAGPALGGIQTLTPRVQAVTSPFVENRVIPNEDARAIDLDDINLFSINRFPGFDRWEGGTRITYGVQWTLDRPRWRVAADVGQSYRFTELPEVYPAGTGLTGNFSDIVGRANVRYSRFVDVTYRFRLDQSNLALRKQDADLTVGTNRTFIQLAYTRLNRNIGIEDLRDREEARAAGRLQFARFWSVYAAGIVDLTGSGEDPLAGRSGFQPIRHRFGLSYEDECLAASLTWRRDYVADRDNRAGDSFLFRLTFKNLGR